MRSYLRSLGIIYLFVSGFVHSEAYSCPQVVENLKSQFLQQQSFCKLHDRYQNAINKIAYHKVAPPERTANILAPRFINYPDWMRERDAKNHNPWFIYGPAPETWMSWEKGAAILQSYVDLNLEEQRLRPFNFNLLSQIHQVSLKTDQKKTGSWRTTQEFGKALSRGSAAPVSTMSTIQSLEYFYSNTADKPLVEWFPAQCLEDRPQQFREFVQQRFNYNRTFYPSEWPVQPASYYFEAPDGSRKQCGYFKYPDPEEVPLQMQKWLEFMNQTISELNQREPSIDLIWAVARIQRWFISIHPYEDGNGRVSRFAMEYILKSLNLPSPLIADLDYDLYLTEKDWAQAIADGMKRTVEQVEDCAANPTSKGCNIVSEKP